MNEETLRALASLPDVRPGAQARLWTAEEDAALLKFWAVKNKEEVARLLGVAEDTARARYRFLRRDK